LRAFRDGERWALGRVYDFYSKEMTTLVRQRAFAMGTFHSAADVLDLVQETFLKAFSDGARQSFDGTREYGPFLRTVARNVVVDWHRRTLRRRESFAGEEELAKHQPATDETSTLAEGDLLEKTEEFVRMLPPELAIVHSLRYEKGLSQEDLARAMGLTRQRVRTLEQRLRDELASYLASPITAKLPRESSLASEIVGARLVATEGGGG